MSPFRELVSPVLLFLYGCWMLAVGASVSHKVISLQEGISTELEALERATLFSHAHHTITEKSAAGQLRDVFHEFERQNQESITAILRVLALVDHTLENTIKDCEKIFDLPSLDSENVVFQDVTRPLLLRVEQLCQRISSEELSGLEADMEAVEQEAARYRTRLDNATVAMHAIFGYLGSHPVEFFAANEIEEPLRRWSLQYEAIESAMNLSVRSFVDKQTVMCNALLEAISDAPQYTEDAPLVKNFLEVVHNESSELESELCDLLAEMTNKTMSLMQLMSDDLTTVLQHMIDSPIERFLELEWSLEELAEYYEGPVLSSVVTSLQSIFQCFSRVDDTAQHFEVVDRLLGRTDSDIDGNLQGLLRCYRSDDPNPEALDLSDSETLLCDDVVEEILDIAESYVEVKMTEISNHISNAMRFEFFKKGVCGFFKSREALKNFEALSTAQKDE